jgi:hypothetical protein
VIFRPGPVKAIFVEKDRLKADEPAIVVRVEGRPPYRFRLLLIDGPAIVSQREGEAWLYTEGAVEGRQEEHKHLKKLT